MHRHNINICFTGMLNAHQWSQGAGYQNQWFTTCEEDKPVIAQISGSHYDLIIGAAKDLSKHCDGVEVNLGCTQKIASRGGYGYFMVDTQQKRRDTIEFFKRLTGEVNVPIGAKIRIFIDDNGEPSEEITLDFVKELEKAGVSFLHIHGRFEHRNKKAEVNVDMIRKIVECVKIPVIANGGITNKNDAMKMIEETGAAGVSVGQALLKNPSVFDENPKSKQEVLVEYINLAKEHKVRFFGPKKHVFLLYESEIKANKELAAEIEKCTTFDDLLNFVQTH
jgi:tRNA-dihydrouridine synthase